VRVMYQMTSDITFWEMWTVGNIQNLPAQDP